MIKLLKGFDIRVRIMSAEHKHHRFCGTVIGSYDGVYGVLLDTGEYADIPADQAQVIMVREMEQWTSKRKDVHGQVQ